MWLTPAFSASDPGGSLAWLRPCQYGKPIMAFQIDNGCEFDKATFRSFLVTRGIVFLAPHRTLSLCGTIINEKESAERKKLDLMQDPKSTRESMR